MTSPDLHVPQPAHGRSTPIGGRRHRHISRLGGVATRTPNTLYGWALRNLDADPAGLAVVNVRDGIDADGALIAQVTLVFNESNREWFGPDGIACNDGLFIELESGGPVRTVVYTER